MPSIISSMGASSKTMFAPLPRVRASGVCDSRGALLNHSTYFGRTGEGDLVDVGVIDQRRTG